MDLLTAALLLILGVSVGTLGTLAGIGGGIILIPFLSAFLPDADPEHVTAISLAVILANAVAGSIAHYRLGNMSVKLASFALLAALPCAVLGTLAVRRVDRESFDVTLGICLCLIGIYLLVKARQSTNRIAQSKPIVLGGQSFWKGLAFCALGGFVSTFLGIGGGIVYVPTLFYVFKAPITTATATSQLIMVGTSLTAILSHINHHSYEGHMALTMILATGCVCGSLLGAKVSGRVRGQTVLSILAVIILLVGIRMIYESSGLHY